MTASKKMLAAGLALLALSHAVVAAETRLTRVLLQAAATAPAPAADAAPPAATPQKATGATVLTASSASIKDGKLTLKGVSDVATVDTPTGYGAIPATLHQLVESSKPGEAAYGVLTGAKGADGKPTVAVLEITVPERAHKGSTLTLNAKFVEQGAATPTGGAVEAALKDEAPGAPPMALDMETVSLTIDNVAPAAPETNGDKNAIGAAVGAGIGSWACGTLCAGERGWWCVACVCLGPSRRASRRPSRRPSRRASYRPARGRSRGSSSCGRGSCTPHFSAAS